MEWFELAAYKGNTQAQFNLGVMLSNGQAFAQDFVSAHMWLNIAASFGNERAAQIRDSPAKRPSDCTACTKTFIEAQNSANIQDKAFHLGNVG